MKNTGEYWRLSGLKLSLAEAEAEQEQLLQKAARALGMPPQKLLSLDIHKKSLDARQADEPFFNYSVDVACASKPRETKLGRGLKLIPLEAKDSGREDWASGIFGLNTQNWSAALTAQPVVVGAGPAGLFAALSLAQAGYRPLLVEQGRPVEQRARDVSDFWQSGQLDESSNVQFGEGGAGAFSDGKLTFRGKDKLAGQVLQTLVQAGAPPEILYWHKPHLGSDKLLEILPRLRQLIIQAGGSILFETRLSGLLLRPHQGRQTLSGLRLEGAFNGEIEASALILAPGNGARATFRMLEHYGVALAAKPFALGLRIEHSQSLIDMVQYGAFAGHRSLPPADYQLKYRDNEGRGFYSFCMCPGGHIVNAASEQGAVLTNGISLAARNSGRANSALVGEVAPGRDFADDALAALTWQQGLEQSAYAAGGEDYALPVCCVEDFLRGYGATMPPADFAPKSAAWRPAELAPLLPEALSNGLVKALLHWQRQIKGFAAGAVLAGLESRTSCPVRILRGANVQSVNTAGLYPAGEGAGYAGGIMSSAIDGLRAAAALKEHYLPPAFINTPSPE